MQGDAASPDRKGDVGFALDASQRVAAERLAVLLDRRGRPRRGSGGVYLHGPPGRGKTMLMDRFFTAARTNRKRRWHFHEFFAHLHAAAATTSTIGEAITRLIGDAELVCFDEFHVHDIGDAMLVARLLDALFARRVPLVVTSNYPPADLLPNPLFHERFLPTIARITERMAVVAVAGPRDYRRSRTEAVTGGGAARAAHARPVGGAGEDACGGHVPSDGPGRVPAHEAGTRQSHAPAHEVGSRQSRDPEEGSARRTGTAATGFAGGAYLVGPPPPAGCATVVRIGSRALTARTAEPGTLETHFDALCGAHLSAADYVALAARFERWVVRDVPRLRTVALDQVMRWVNLIDILYDADRTLTVYAAAPIEELAAGVARVAGLSDLGRTVSRLYEISHHGDARAG